MDSTLEFFAWTRPLQGYAWEDAVVNPGGLFNPDPNSGDVGEKRFLRWRDGTSRAVTETPLFNNPTLFREFAALEPTEASFLAFANQHGWLGVSTLLQGELSERDGKPVRTINFADPRAHGEPYWRWKAAHLAMSKVNDVLLAIWTDDDATLSKWFTVGADAVHYDREAAWGRDMEWVCGGTPPMRPALWKWGQQGKSESERLKRYASIWAQKRINDALGNNDNGTSTSVRVLVNDVKDAMSLHIVPDTLLAAMWLQCARVLTENPKFKACENCGKWFELSLSPSGKRKHAMYCSAQCKLAAHRARIPTTCEQCGTQFNISVKAGSGFAYMNHYDVACPKCGLSSSRLLPGEVRGVSLRGKRQSDAG